MATSMITGGVIPSPEAFVGVLVTLATTRGRDENRQTLGEFVHHMAHGRQADLLWLKGLIISILLSIPNYDHTAAFEVFKCLCAMECAGENQQERNLEWVKSMAMAALCAGVATFADRGLPARQHGELAFANISPFVRLVTGFGQDTWCIDVAHAKPLITRLFGQLQAGTEDDRAWLRLFAWELAKTELGTRILQQVVKQCTRDEGKVLFQSMKDHIWDACLDPHANHLLAECMRFLPAESWQSVVLQELEGHYKEAAQNDTGCRVLQRLIEHIAPSDLRSLRAEVIDDHLVLREVMLDKFGNYVVQHCLEHDEAEEQVRQQVVNELCRCDRSCYQGIHELARHKAASNVLDKALTYCTPEGLGRLVDTLLKDPGSLANMKNCQFGSFVFKHLHCVFAKTFNQNSFDRRSFLVLQALMKNPQSLESLKLTDAVKTLLLVSSHGSSPPGVLVSDLHGAASWSACSTAPADQGTLAICGPEKQPGKPRRRKRCKPRQAQEKIGFNNTEAR